MARWHSANVLQAAGAKKRLWQFTLRGGNPNLAREETRLPADPLPPKLISKDWQTLYQPKLNIAWLPADKVFLRVVQLPPADNFAETASMVELQLEKVSPLPTTQIVWTFELLPKGEGPSQTAIVVIAARNLVEEFLGKLETNGYLADRLEEPLIDQLLATQITGDGVWVYPGEGADENNCLVAWWYGGVLHSVSLLHLPPAEERGPFLREQIAQMAWAGELEGWITSPPGRFLVATPEVAALWQPLLQEGEQHVALVAPLSDTELAKLTARRAARENAAASLVPPEFIARYRQQFVDRIWMRSVFAVAIFYLFGVLVYLALVQYVDFNVSKIEQQARNLSPTYTNAIRLKDQVRVMQDQLNLQFAALECYKAVAQKLPESVVMDTFNFSEGKSLRLSGTASSGAQNRLTEFSDELRQVISNNQPLFSKVAVPSVTLRGDQLMWSMEAELAREGSE
ncbi:MAG TPA: hypothetical protein VNT99_00300 [Methylomirabilota bacterium]|nr:hypothetical protein [Methylomirabilota bacterium]